MAEFWRLDRCIGAVTQPYNSLGVASDLHLPPGFMTVAQNVRLSDTRVLHPRTGLAVVSTSGGATASIRYVFTERIGGTEAVWTVTGSGPLTAYRNNSATTLSDTTADGQPSFACHNGKVFMAYNSDVNRLHVYDTNMSVPAVRRVGVDQPAAATVANQGAGAYPATIRYYKVQMYVLANPADASSKHLASSELSPVVSFTPSGAGTAARVTKPATVDSATHWRVYGSSDGITFYQITGKLAVGTTFFDDTLTPSAYNLEGGVVAPEAGLFVPPPSAKFLATNGERLVMAGAWETTATASQTAVSSRRVWFTRILGVTDEGDDEAITQTGEFRFYLDINNEDGSEITGMASALDGSILVFTTTSIWRLSDTGNAEAPFRPERVSNTIGAVSHSAIATADDVTYFMSPHGPFRYSQSLGVQFIGADWFEPRTAIQGAVIDTMAAGYDPLFREVYFAYSGSNFVRILQPALLQQVGMALRGGWTENIYAQGNASSGTFRLRSMSTYENMILVAGTAPDGGDMLAKPSAANADLGDTFTASITTPTLTFGSGVSMGAVSEVYGWKNRGVEVGLTLTVNFGGTNNVTVTDTLASEAIIAGEARRHLAKAEGMAAGDAVAVRLTATISTADYENPVDLLVVQYATKELA